MAITSPTQLEDYFTQRQAMHNNVAKEFRSQTSNNFDMTLIAPAVANLFNVEYEGMELGVDLHTDSKVLSSIKSEKPMVALLQVWDEKTLKSIMIGFTQEMIDDAGHDYYNQQVLAQDDLLNRAIAAIRLVHDGHPLLTHVAMCLAYGAPKDDQEPTPLPGVKSSAIRRIWD
jgi:hypothetical protein